MILFVDSLMALCQIIRCHGAPGILHQVLPPALFSYNWAKGTQRKKIIPVANSQLWTSAHVKRVWEHSTSVAAPTDIDVIDGPLLDLRDCRISLSWHNYAVWSGYMWLSSSCGIPHISSVVLRCPGLTLCLKPAETVKYGVAAVPYVT